LYEDALMVKLDQWKDVLIMTQQNKFIDLRVTNSLRRCVQQQLRGLLIYMSDRSQGYLGVLNLPDRSLYVNENNSNFVSPD